MSTTQSFNNTVYTIPTQGDPAPWGPALDRYLIALGTYAFSPAGGSYPLTADLNLGSSFGLVAPYYKTSTALPATAGTLRLAKTDAVEWRNNVNSGNNVLSIDGSDNLTYNGTVINNNLSALPNGEIWIGNASNVPIGHTFTGDVTVSNTGVTTIPAGTITNSYINNAAAIAYSKLSLTGSIVNSDIFSSAAIAYSKLNLASSIANSDLAGGVYSAITGLGTQSQALDMNSHKVTNLTNGSSAQDAVAFVQILGFRILQIITANTSTNQSSTSGTYADTTLTATITPTLSTSKILVLVSQECECNGAGGINVCGVQLLRAGSIIYGPFPAAYQAAVATNDVHEQYVIFYLDSPATTSATIYKTQYARAAGSGTVQVQGQPNGITSNSTITLLEIG